MAKPKQTRFWRACPNCQWHGLISEHQTYCPMAVCGWTQLSPRFSREKDLLETLASLEIYHELVGRIAGQNSIKSPFKEIESLNGDQKKSNEPELRPDEMVEYKVFDGDQETFLKRCKADPSLLGLDELKELDEQLVDEPQIVDLFEITDTDIIVKEKGDI